MSHVQAFLDAHPDLKLSVQYVWLPMFPRFAERRALPGITAKYAHPRTKQYWDDTKALGIELKRRITPDFRGDVVWDTFLLFDADATWADAEQHLLTWGFTVVAQKDTLFAALEALDTTPAPAAAVETADDEDA